ncbi:exopolysaccharide production protein ExoF [Mesorhizobium sp. J18]|uniref:polysaccharide biosynthesis/export family protein n=1 Tax=Mesorhizobium sp. J18 TaxID=935263 RepID=UPI00119C7FC1|nr:polysaccharide biosynthesis/export family protein [Mesorhizobium sp. J18]TWG90117.1 exopolysaccharide production protein ExoF [Mesorhizobium sp. J18]
MKAAFVLSRGAPLAGMRCVCIFVAILTLLLTGAGVSAAEYELGPMDKLRIKVAEWQTAEGAVREWSSVAGDYTVGPSGSISLPFVGQIPAAGKTTAEIEETIADELQQRFGLLDRPAASVEIIEYRPIFVTGDVQNPGRYPYDPGLTVLRTVSVAGGLRRSADASLRIERDYINAQGNLEVLIAERNRLYARRARLQAEAQGAASITMPEELADLDIAEKLLAEEAGFMEARRKRVELQLEGIEDLKQLLRNEIESLEKKIATQNRQIELSREELKGVGSLAERGLTVNARVLTVEQTIAEMEGKVLDMETAVLRARQDINGAEQDATNLQNDRESEISQQQQETEAKIEALTLQIEMYKKLMAEALSNAPALALEGEDDMNRVILRIVRAADGKTEEIAADQNTAVLPGDVVKVKIPPLLSD